MQYIRHTKGKKYKLRETRDGFYEAGGIKFSKRVFKKQDLLKFYR